MVTEFKIQIPEGMEIDKENSTFECIKFKPKELTYIEISKKFQPYNYSVYTNTDHLSKLKTFRQLLEVADYLNGDWKPDWTNDTQYKCIISYNGIKETLYIQSCWYVTQGLVCFSSRENAEKAINIIGEKNLLNFFKSCVG